MERRFDQSPLTCTLVGSFRYMDQFNVAREKLTSAGVKVLAPGGSLVSEQRGSFRMLDCDSNSSHPIDLEAGFLSALLRSDFGYIIDPEGYMGVASVTETTIAKCFGVPFISREPVSVKLDKTNLNWQNFCRSIPSCPLDQLAKKVEDQNDPIHKTHLTNIRSLVPVENIEDLALYILSSEWLKHRGLGYIVGEVQRHRNNFMLGRLEQTCEFHRMKILQI